MELSLHECRYHVNHHPSTVSIVGLTVVDRLDRDGPNRLKTRGPRPTLRILLDRADALAAEGLRVRTIVREIHHGRVIDQNIRRFVRYLLSCNLSEVAVVLGASAMGLPMPILPLQILYLNLMTDVFPALALGVGEGASGIMRRPPRPADAPIVSRRGWFVIAWQGAAIAAATIIALITAAGWLMVTPAQAVTASFLTLGLAQVWHVLDMRGLGSHPLRNDVIRNPWVLGSIVLCLMLLAAAVHLKPLSHPLGLDPGEPAVTVRIWSLAILCSLLPVALIQISLGRARPSRVYAA